MVIFYLQVRHRLPSLHRLSEKTSVYAFDFGTESSELHGRPSLGELLKGFFRYYGQEFAWERQVVSVRLGRVAEVGSEVFSKKLFESTRYGKKWVAPKWLSIEDPIELERNLNFALTEETVLKMMHEIKSCVDLEEGQELEEIPKLDSSCPEGLEGYLDLPELGRTPARCYRCQKIFPSYPKLMRHQSPMRCRYPYSCRCGKGFVKRADLESHQQAKSCRVWRRELKKELLKLDFMAGQVNSHAADPVVRLAGGEQRCHRSAKALLEESLLRRQLLAPHLEQMERLLGARLYVLHQVGSEKRRVWWEAHYRESFQELFEHVASFLGLRWAA